MKVLLLSTYPSTLDPGEVPSGYRITVRLGINRGSLGLSPGSTSLDRRLMSSDNPASAISLLLFGPSPNSLKPNLTRLLFIFANDSTLSDDTPALASHLTAVALCSTVLTPIGTSARSNLLPGFELDWSSGLLPDLTCF